MTVKVAINGFGRMGRLALRAAWGFDPARAEALTAPGEAWGGWCAGHRAHQRAERQCRNVGAFTGLRQRARTLAGRRRSAG